MSIPFERIVREDLNIGHGQTRVSMPGGGVTVGNKIGLHTFAGAYNVQEFGARGDGVIDDTVAIRLALMAALAVNGELVFPPGIYPFSSEITVTGRVTIRGAGPGTSTGTTHAGTILRKTADGYGIHLTSAAGFSVLEGFCLDNTAATGLGPTYSDGIVVGDGDVTSGAEHVVIQHVRVVDQKGHGIHLRNGNFGRMDSVSLSGNAGHGLLLDNRRPGLVNVNQWVMTHLHASTNTGDGIHIEASRSNLLMGFTADHNTGYGLQVNEAYQMAMGLLEDNTAGPARLNRSCVHSLFYLRVVDGTVTVDEESDQNFIYLLDEASGGLPFYVVPDEGGGGGVRFTKRVSFPIQLLAQSGGTGITPLVAQHFIVTVSDGVGFQINLPYSRYATPVTFTIKNASGGAMGTVTWNGYSLATWVNPANGYCRSITFVNLGAENDRWTEISRTPADVPYQV